MKTLDDIRDAIHGATGSLPEGLPRPVGGGCINETYRLGAFFVKIGAPSQSLMFSRERLGLDALARSRTVRVPETVCCGTTPNHAYLVLEFLPLQAHTINSHETLGRQLASLHRCSQEKFGWVVDNFIGSTPQPNPTCESWIQFYREHRLRHLLELSARDGHRFRQADRLLDNLESFFDQDEPQPSLLHGDLWSGNAAALAAGTPVLFDPAVYFGDREADLAMTRLFGGFSTPFYHAYQEAWPLPPGHRLRRDLYNLYHILNHAILFGGSYRHQAQGMIDSLVAAL